VGRISYPEIEISVFDVRNGLGDKAAAVIDDNFLGDFIFFLLPFCEIVQVFLFPIFKAGKHFTSTISALHGPLGLKFSSNRKDDPQQDHTFRDAQSKCLNFGHSSCRLTFSPRQWYIGRFSSGRAQGLFGRATRVRDWQEFSYF
jgi:hypothetical protein